MTDLKKSIVTYSSNNSGGGWWLSDDDWYALESAGWKIDWFKDREYLTTDENGRWLGARAGGATREGLTLDEAVAEFERMTGQDASAVGCGCCGPPHSFHDDDWMFNDHDEDEGYDQYEDDDEYDYVVYEPAGELEA